MQHICIMLRDVVTLLPGGVNSKKEKAAVYRGYAVNSGLFNDRLSPSGHHDARPPPAMRGGFHAGKARAKNLTKWELASLQAEGLSSPHTQTHFLYLRLRVLPVLPSLSMPRRSSA